MLVAASVFVFTLILVIWQPKGLGVGWSATIGAVIALLVGAVSLQDIPTVWAIVWNATATFIAKPEAQGRNLMGNLFTVIET